LGVIPFDYDDLVLAEREQHRRFLESSSTLTMSRWEHEVSWRLPSEVARLRTCCGSNLAGWDVEPRVPCGDATSRRNNLSPQTPPTGALLRGRVESFHIAPWFAHFRALLRAEISRSC
jgi:hypothetical protein